MFFFHQWLELEKLIWLEAAEKWIVKVGQIKILNFHVNSYCSVMMKALKFFL